MAKTRVRAHETASNQREEVPVPPGAGMSVPPPSVDEVLLALSQQVQALTTAVQGLQQQQQRPVGELENQQAREPH